MMMSLINRITFLLSFVHRSVVPDGEGFLQRVERRTVDDVFYAGDVLGTLDGGEVQLRDDALDFAEHGILSLTSFSSSLMSSLVSFSCFTFSIT